MKRQLAVCFVMMHHVVVLARKAILHGLSVPFALAMRSWQAGGLPSAQTKIWKLPKKPASITTDQYASGRCWVVALKARYYLHFPRSPSTSAASVARILSSWHRRLSAPTTRWWRELSRQVGQVYSSRQSAYRRYVRCRLVSTPVSRMGLRISTLSATWNS